MNFEHIGFTGTRLGMTDAQKAIVSQILTDLQASTVHHGDCKGADINLHIIARNLGLHIVGHPPIKKSLRAFASFDEEREPKDYLSRDRDIVNESEFLIAVPRGFEEEKKSGTWYTIRYAYSQDKPILIVWPDGKIGPYVPI